MALAVEVIPVGASAWAHFGPYHPNLVEAFRHLCERVFETGEYWSPWRPPDQERVEVTRDVDEWIADRGLEDLLETHTHFTPQGEAIRPVSREEVIDLLCRSGPEPPQTIEELLEYNGQDGTHSVLDYYSPDPEQAKRYLQPFSDMALWWLFGTNRPTRSMIEEQRDRIWFLVLSEAGANEGTYVVAYKDDLPHEIFVIGISGD